MNDSLTQEEAEFMIAMLKSSLIEQLTLPGKGEHKSFQVQGNSNRIFFDIAIFRGKINHTKVSCNARISVNNTVLLELHLHPTNRHINPDGEEIISSHWHIYREGYGHSFAYPATEITDDDFVKNTLLFLKKFNVVDLPKVSEQLSFDI